MIPADRDDPAHDYFNGSSGTQINVSAAMCANAPRSDTLSPSAVASADRINTIQRYFLNDTQLGVPLRPSEETLHGLGSEGATTFPQAVVLAAPLVTALVSRVASAIPPCNQSTP